MKNFTKGFILAIYFLMDILIAVGLYLFKIVITDAAIIPQKFLAYLFFIVFLIFIAFLIFRQIYFFKYYLFNVKSINIDEEEIWFFKGKKKYSHSIKNITKVKIRSQTTTVYCNSPHKKYILDTRRDSPFFTENVNTDELKDKLIYAEFI